MRYVIEFRNGYLPVGDDLERAAECLEWHNVGDVPATLIDTQQRTDRGGLRIAVTLSYGAWLRRTGADGGSRAGIVTGA